MKASLFLLIMTVLTSAVTFAGSTTGGGFPSKLETIALSETFMSAAEMREAIGGIDLEPKLSNLRLASSRMMESASEKPAGILIEVTPENFNLVSSDAASGKEFIYRDIAARPIAVNSESKIVSMQLVEEPSVVIIVKESQAD